MNSAGRKDHAPRSRLVLAVLLALLPAAFIAGRATDPQRLTVRQMEAVPVPRELPPGLYRLHDAGEGVTCWRMDGREGISCLPDQWLASARIEADAP